MPTKAKTKTKTKAKAKTTTQAKAKTTQSHDGVYERLASLEAKLVALHEDVQAIRSKVYNGLTLDVAVLKEQMREIQAEGEQRLNAVIVEALERIEKNTRLEVEETREAVRKQEQGNRLARLFGTLGALFGFASILVTLLAVLGIIKLP